MFEQTLITYLKSDSTLCSYVSTYNASPSIFSDEAPEDSTHPYIVTRIMRSATENIPVQEFTLYADYYDYNISRVYERKAVERLEMLLDRHNFSDDSRYGRIRTSFFSGDSVEESDPRDLHYNMQFYVRAGRKNFCEFVT